MTSIELAVRFGKEILIENVLEELDPALDPILIKQTFTQNNQLVSNERYYITSICKFTLKCYVTTEGLRN